MIWEEELLVVFVNTLQQDVDKLLFLSLALDYQGVLLCKSFLVAPEWHKQQESGQCRSQHCGKSVLV